MRIVLFYLLFFNSCSNSIAQNFDINLLNKVNSPPSLSSDKSWVFLTNTTLPLSLATPVTIFITGVANNDNELKRKSYGAGASMLLSSLITTGFKQTFKRERPFISYPDIIYKKRSASGYSFPSGHTTAAFATATSISLAFPKWYVIFPSFTYAAAISYSRMYLGVHYPTDILAGILVGIGTSLLSNQVQKNIN